MTGNWRNRARTAEAVAGLCMARLLIAWVPFRRWRDSLGRTVRSDPGIGSGIGSGIGPGLHPVAGGPELTLARDLAGRVERAAWRLPFETRCLPRAMALVWMLQRRRISYTAKIAVRPKSRRGGLDDLHAWVERDGIVLIGALPGPWIVTIALAG